MSFFNWFHKPLPNIEPSAEHKSAYLMGVNAYAANINFHENPFSDNTSVIFDFIRWQAGWQNAYRKSNDTFHV